MSDLLNKASLVVIPSGYKEDTVYSVVPSDGSGDLSFTRASNGTRINSAGLVEVTPWNLVQYSEDFSNAVWTTANLSISANTTTAPNGTTTADTITEDTSTTRKILYTTPTIVANQEITLTIYVKKNTLQYVRLIANDLSENFRWFGAQFDLTALTYTSATGSNGNATFTSASITDAGNGWYRIAVSGTINTTSLLFGIFPSNGATLSSSDDRGGNTYLGTGKTAYIWGAQLNIGSTAKPYFPTTDRLNVPRLTYQNGGGGCPSLLLEKQSTNLITYSEDFSGATWLNEDIIVSTNQTISPDGTQNADKLIANTTTLDHSIYQTSSGSTRTFSVYAKAGEYNYIFLGSNNNTALDGAFFNLSNGTISQNTSGLTASIESVGNGWYRCIVSSTSWPTIYTILCLSTNGTSLGFTGNNTSGIYVWGCQVENSSYPTSYIPTTSASATRVADGPVNLSTTQTLTNFTLFWDGLIFQNGENMFFGSGNSAWYIDIDGSNGRIVLDLASGRIYNAFSSLTTNQRCKLAVKRSAGVVDAFVNGTKLTPNTQVTDTTSLTLSSITWGFSSTYYPKMKVNEICAFQSALSDSDCQALTTL